MPSSVPTLTLGGKLARKLVGEGYVSESPVQFYEAPTQATEILAQLNRLNLNKMWVGWGNLCNSKIRYLLPL